MEKRLIDANSLKGDFMFLRKMWSGTEVMAMIDDAPTVDAVEVARIEEVKQEILSRINMFIAEYKRTSLNCNDRDGGKAEAMEVARRLVNAALTDLCTNCGAKMDG